MADIQTLLKNILSKVYGKDVRQSIHDAIRQCYYDGKVGGYDLEARDRAAAAEARMDTFTSLKAGSTTGDAELRDIRVGAFKDPSTNKATVYSSAGAAVRAQIRANHIIEIGSAEPVRENVVMWIDPNNQNTFELPEVMDDDVLDTDTWSSRKIKYELDKFSNLISLNETWTNGSFIRHVDGGVTNHAQYKSTDYVKRPNGTIIHYKCEFGSGAGIAIYDDNYRFIKSIKNPDTSTVPSSYLMEGTIDEGHYIRFSSLINNDSNNKGYSEPEIYMIQKSKAEMTHCDYEGDEISVFNRILCMGDSLTSGTFNYKENNTDKYVNDSNYSYPTYLKKLTGTSVINLAYGGKTSSEYYDTIKDQNITGFDAAIIQLGVNDYYRYNGWYDTSSTAFTNIINKLKRSNENIKIFVSTIIPAISYPANTFNVISEGIRDLVESLNDPNVILLDMAEYGHTADDTAYNCGHLSALGYYKLAKDYKAYISYYISQHPNEFREVQFIGTDMSYV